MALPQEQSQRLLRHLNEKWRNKNCYQCGANSWTPHGVVQLTVADPEVRALVVGGPVLPCAALLCVNCGHTVLVNLVVAGVLPSDRPAATATADSAPKENG